MRYSLNRLAAAATLAAGLALAPAAAAQPIIYVDADASGGDDGSSWANAFEELDEALDAAGASAQIWVAEGTYYPTDDPDRDESFFLKNGVAIYGGFTGVETSLDERTADPDENGCVLSGDIGVADDDSDNSYHVVSAIGVDNTAVLDGFLVTGGNADGSAPNERGGGLTNFDGGSNGADTEGYPTLRNVAFEGNRASDFGGGAYFNSTLGPVVMEDVEFKENEARRGGGIYTNASIDGTGVEFEENAASQRGGGAAILGGTIVLREVEFDSNTVGDDDTPEEPGRGAGFYVQGTPTVTMIDAEFELNACRGFFGDGAGFLVQGGVTNIVNAVFNGNTARAGAAFMSRNVEAPGGATVNVTNAVIAGNQGADESGSVVDLNDATASTLAHLTVSGNDGAAIMRFGPSTDVSLYNLIVWDNDFETTPIVVNQSPESGGSVDVDHAIVEGGFPDGEAIFSDDPLFFAAPDDGPDDEWGTDDDDYGDLRLQPGSPAVSLGDLDLVPEDRFDLDDDGVTTELLPFDLDGERRVQDGSVELGAYEGVGTPVATEPGAITQADLALSNARPNPARSRATLALTVASAEPVRVAVYDLLGREVLRLHDGPVAAGTLALGFDASALSAGLYVVRAASASGTAVRRVTVVR